MDRWLVLRSPDGRADRPALRDSARANDDPTSPTGTSRSGAIGRPTRRYIPYNPPAQSSHQRNAPLRPSPLRRVLVRAGDDLRLFEDEFEEALQLGESNSFRLRAHEGTNGAQTGSSSLILMPPPSQQALSDGRRRRRPTTPPRSNRVPPNIPFGLTQQDFEHLDPPSESLSGPLMPVPMMMIINLGALRSMGVMSAESIDQFCREQNQEESPFD